MEIDKSTIVERMKLIERYVTRLRGLQSLSNGDFYSPDNSDIAAYNLRSALEAIFDICGHILARIPGAQIDEYKKMAMEMGRQGIVSKEFAENILIKMAGYRNRLTHFYFEIGQKEIYEIIQHDLGDFDTLLKYIKRYLENQ